MTNEIKNLENEIELNEIENLENEMELNEIENELERISNTQVHTDEFEFETNEKSIWE